MTKSSKEEYQGCPFTRVDPSNTNVNSCLSLVIISVGLEEYVHELLIDKERQFTPHRAVQKNRSPEVHFSLLITFKNIPQKMKSLNKARSSVMWNTRKEDGWKKYHELTSNDVKLKKIAESSNELSSDEIMGKLSRRMDKIKFQAFGKVKIKSRTVTNDRELAKLYDEKAKENSDQDEMDKKINNKILLYQLKGYEMKLYQLEQLKKEKGNSAAIFRLKEKIVGSKKVSQEAVTMKDPETGEIIVESEKLKEASVKYVSNLLTNRVPKDAFKKEFHLMESLNELRMNDLSNSEEEKDFQEFLKQISKNKNYKNQFILKAGESFRKVLLTLYRKVWKSEKNQKKHLLAEDNLCPALQIKR